MTKTVTERPPAHASYCSGVMKASVSSSESPRSGYVSLIVVLLGAIVRLALPFLTEGSPDISAWEAFGTAVSDHGFTWAYNHHALLNHPPIVLYVVGILVSVTRYLEFPFPILFRLFTAGADILTGIILYYVTKYSTGDVRRASRRHCLYSVSLCSLCVGSIHGNTDSICVMFAFLSMLFFQCSGFFCSGLTLAFSLNIKLIPLLLLPAFISCIYARRDLVRFSSGLFLGLFPFYVAVTFIGENFVRNVLNYSPDVNFLWGVSLLLYVSHYSIDFIEELATTGRAALLALVTVIALGHRYLKKLELLELLTLTFGLFAAFAPIFAMQYTIYLSPFLIASSPLLGVLYSTLTGLLLADIYFTWDSLLGAKEGTPLGVLLSLLAWSSTLLVSYCFIVRKAFSRGQLNGPPMKTEDKHHLGEFRQP